MFRAIWLATLFSNFGIWVQSTAAAWAMTTLAPSPDMVALVQSASAAPILLFSLLAGALADVIDRRILYLAAQLLVAAVAILLSVVGYFDLLGAWLLLALTFLIGVGTALRQPAFQATVGDLVPRHELVRAIALNSLNFNFARSFGPALGGLLIATIGIQGAFLFNAISNLGIIGVLMAWKRPREIGRLPPESVGRAVFSGLRYVAGSPRILTAMARTFLFTFCAAPVWALLPSVAREDLGGGPSDYGVLLGSLGVGAILGGAAIGRLRDRLTPHAIVWLSTLMFAAASLAMAYVRMIEIVAPMLVIGGAAWLMAMNSFNITVQVSAADWVKGRALSVYFLSLFGGLSFGSWLWGLLADRTGLSTALAAAAVGLVLTDLVGHWLRLPAKMDMDLRPSSRLRRAVAVPDLPPASTVTILIEYEIEPGREPEFVDAMRALGRLRQRDGGRHWRLNQRLGRTERWIESFEFGSWMDYLRSLERLTIADEAVFDRVRGLHIGDEPPVETQLVLKAD